MKVWKKMFEIKRTYFLEKYDCNGSENRNWIEFWICFWANTLENCPLCNSITKSLPSLVHSSQTSELCEPNKLISFSFWCDCLSYLPIKVGTLELQQYCFLQILFSCSTPLTPDWPQVKRPPPSLQIISNFLVFMGFHMVSLLKRSVCSKSYIFKSLMNYFLKLFFVYKT